MALCQFPLNLHTLSSSLPQPGVIHVNSSFRIRRLKFHRFNDTVRCSTIKAAIDIDTQQRTTKKKRKPKPGFYDEISDKWSSRISPKTQNFPWQNQNQEEEEEEDESRENQFSGKKTDSNFRVSPGDRSSFPRPSGYISAPWVNIGSEAHKDIRNPDGFSAIRQRRDNDSGNRTVDDDVTGGARDSEKDKGVWRSKRNNTVEAERIVPEHELIRLRNVALRMTERVKVGSAGITQALVNTIHEKWEVDEVVKLKFTEPCSLNMKRTHENLEVRFHYVVRQKELYLSVEF